MLRIFLIIGAASVVLAACTASGGGASSANPPASVPSADPSTEPSTEPAGDGGSSLPTSVTDPIVADAAARLGVDPSAVTIVDGHAETWSDGSLGCPEPGMMYTQALVEGYQVVVEANGTLLDYRGGGSGQFRLCEAP
ncbi:MAG TPA: hypothetical protein VM408_04275 [Methylomirabilota bacterium]|nr:hypothetical protein [Methylomirabilota bacterium]